MDEDALKFVEENLEDIKLISEHGNPQMRKIATAVLAVYFKKMKKKYN
jgi:hypothetical protein